MVFLPPSWMPELPNPPDSVPISQFMLDEKHGRHPFKLSRAPFTCGLSGIEYSWEQIRERVHALSSVLSEELGFKPNHGSEFDKVVCIFSVNTVRWRDHESL